ncbi:MAG: methionyl-tRNA formyltransferase [Alphaproteobacteria bacterium]|nr:methionyl-tRNA formyltransferase [Alphaproteobacteria bacterium]
MRIIFNGQQAFGKAVLEAMLARGDNVIAVYCAPEKPGQKIDPLKEFALSKGLIVHQPASFKTPDVHEQVKSLNPDLGVMAYVTLFVPSTILNIPKLGTIQYHPSLLPLHRGPSSINWPIIMGETKTGLSIFWPDDGLDTGPLLSQKEVEIKDTDTLGTLYFDQLFPLGVKAMLEGIDLVKAGKAPKIKQDESKATYESWCRKKDGEIDWSKPAAAVYNLIRGCNPQPGAWTRHQGKILEIYDCVKRAGEAGGAPGTVSAIDADGVRIAAAGGQILVKRVKPEGEGKAGAADWAAKVGLAVGVKLG